MRRYEIELDEAVSKFFEEIAIIAHRPIAEILSDALFKQVEMINRKYRNLLSLMIKICLNNNRMG